MKTWKTKDGQRIKIADLATDHLRNILAMLWRQREAAYLALVEPYLVGPYPNGEMAQDAFDVEFSQVMGIDAVELFRQRTRSLRREAKRRAIHHSEWRK